MSKWILIEVQDNTINEPDVYNTYNEAYAEMKKRFDSINESYYKDDEANIKEDYAFVFYDSIMIDWRIFEIKYSRNNGLDGGILKCYSTHW